ncbi:YqjD family protein [Sulfuriferula sp. AH1]|uniref:DUF883 family protein n=1 Tax=Sulfuriferula sp. AH1 TaxID=1985873 RepID=UPI0026B55ADF
MNTIISDLQADAAKAPLENDLQAVIADTEALLKLTANQGGESIQALRGKAEKSLAVAKVKMTEAHDVLMEKTGAALRATDHYVHEKPWHAVTFAAGAGLVAGLLMGRR